ncbi:MAG: ankyrin repeat domain-containing protein, partial [Hyphomicrobiaceae bacterium]
MTASVFDLHNAVYAEDIARVKEVAHPGNVNTNVHHRASPFHMACFNGDLDICRILIARGADLLARGPLQELGEQPLTALDVAQARGHKQLAEIIAPLLAHDTPDARKAVAQEVAQTHGFIDALVDTPAPASQDERVLAAERLYNAIVAGDRASVWALARAWNINIELHHYGTPFHLACFKGNRAIVDMLLSVGADPTRTARLQEFGEERPAQIAARMGHEALAHYLASQKS